MIIKTQIEEKEERIVITKQTDELAGNIVKLMHKSDSLMKIAGSKSGVNVWEMPDKIADQGSVEILEKTLITVQKSIEQLEARFCKLEQDYCNQMMPSFQESDAARANAEYRLNFENRLIDVETVLKGFNHTNPALRKSLNDTLAIMQTPVVTPKNNKNDSL